MTKGENTVIIWILIIAVIFIARQRTEVNHELMELRNDVIDAGVCYSEANQELEKRERCDWMMSDMLKDIKEELQ